MINSNLYNLYINQGATYLRSATYLDNDGNPVDMTGYTMAAQIRQTYQDADILATIDCEIVTPASGYFTFGLDATTTALLPATGNQPGQLPNFVWDMKIIDPSNVVTRLLQGSVFVSPEVTQ